MSGMTENSVVPVLDLQDQRLIAALQCDVRLTAERAGQVLGISPRTVHRRWRALMADGTLRVLAEASWPDSRGALLLRIRVLRGKLDVIAAALAAREDIAFIDLATSGDEISAVAWTDPGSRDALVFRQLPSTQAVTSVTAATVLHVFRVAAEWRHDVLTDAEVAALSSGAVQAERDQAWDQDHARDQEHAQNRDQGRDHALDDVDTAILSVLKEDARASAAAVAARTGYAESTVRRRIAQLVERGRLLTQVVVDPKRLGLTIDANVMMQVSPGRLDQVGRALAAHPAVHGAFATTGPANLYAAVWVRDLAELYRFITHDLGGLGVDSVETVIVGQAVKRPGKTLAIGR